jgi:glyoxylase-like metal-dependent hydrolase (beta-lactamase superfamily II)
VVRVTAPNGGPYTFTGTNSFIVGHDTIAVIDPGPDDSRHLAALVKAIGGRRVERIILTHTHIDHSALARRLKRETGAMLSFAGPHRLSRPKRPFEFNMLSGGCDWALMPDETLADGETVVAGDVALLAMATPGHCANHMAFGIKDSEWLFTGDDIMGWNSTLVAVPDGSMADYLASMEKVIAAPYRRYLPAHGGPIADGPGYARALLAHRNLRNNQIVDAVNKGARTTTALLRLIYKGIAPTLNLAARMTIEAHVEYLAARGDIAARRTLLGWRLTPRR